MANPNRGLRWLFASGFALMLLGFGVVGFSEGSGPPPSVSESTIYKLAGTTIFVLGTITSIGAGVRLYVVENRFRK
jgi:hypothetical protein